MVDVTFQSTLFFIKSLFSVQNSLALLVSVNCMTEHEYVKGNPRDYGLLGLAHYKCFGAQSLLSADATIKEKKGGKKPQNIRKKNFIFIGCSLIYISKKWLTALKHLSII